MIRLQKNSKQAEEHFNVASILIKKRIDSLVKKKSIGRNKIIPLTAEVEQFLKDLLIGDNLKKLIIKDPENLTSLIQGISTNYPSFVIPNSNENLLLRNVFISHGYNHADFNKLQFIERINIDTCPYCNRSYIYYLSKKGEIKPQIDHFYPTNLYPFF